jgi:hypothetical protein
MSKFLNSLSSSYKLPSSGLQTSSTSTKAIYPSDQPVSIRPGLSYKSYRPNLDPTSSVPYRNSFGSSFTLLYPNKPAILDTPTPYMKAPSAMTGLNRDFITKEDKMSDDPGDDAGFDKDEDHSYNIHESTGVEYYDHIRIEEEEEERPKMVSTKSRKRKSISFRIPKNVENLSEQAQLRLAMKESLRILQEQNQNQSQSQSHNSSSSSVAAAGNSRQHLVRKKILSRKSIKHLDSPLEHDEEEDYLASSSLKSSDEAASLGYKDSGIRKRSRSSVEVLLKDEDAQDKLDVDCHSDDDDDQDAEFVTATRSNKTRQASTSSSASSSYACKAIKVPINIGSSSSMQYIAHHASATGHESTTHLVKMPPLPRECRYEGVYAHRNRYKAYLELK